MNEPKDRDELLAELGACYGIQDSYWDVFGAQHHTSSDTSRLFLSAMGVPTASAALLRLARAEQLSRAWWRLLPPVAVRTTPGAGGDAGEADPRPIPLTLPEDCRDRLFRWRIDLETGEQRDGQLRPRDLDLLERRRVDGVDFARFAWPLPDQLPWGYHTLRLAPRDRSPLLSAEMTLIGTPTRCFIPPQIDRGQRYWGPAVQLYALRSPRNWGIGDFTDLRRMVEVAAELGASIVGLNPLHALFPHCPRRHSPYSPSSRLFLNALYIDVEAVAEEDATDETRRAIDSAELQRALAEARRGELIDYEAVGAVKLALLEQLHDGFRRRHLGATPTARGRAFRDFVAAEGQPLQLHAVCEALQQHFFAEDEQIWGWPVWPAAYRDPASPEVQRFAAEHVEEVELFEYLQWLADQQLGAAAERAEQLGLGVGLYADLAVSVNSGGAEVWAAQRHFAMDAAAGAPPDALAPKGQNWGLPPLIPHRLQQSAYAPLIAVLRRNMRHAGALRIDHVMGLMRVFWVPRDRPATEGAYVRYPFDDLLGVIALESQRNRCMVIGEDLGTVPDEVREALHRWRILSYRVLLFERDQQGELKRPADYPRQALVTAATHDLPTLCGYWSGRDLDLRVELDLFPSDEHRDHEKAERVRDRRRLLRALAREGLLPAGASTDPAQHPELSAELAVALQSYLARSPAYLMTVQWEDVLGLTEQVNLPGTTEQHPNWRRRLPLTVDELAAVPAVAALREALSRPPADRVDASNPSPPAAERGG